MTAYSFLVASCFTLKLGPFADDDTADGDDDDDIVDDDDDDDDADGNGNSVGDGCTTSSSLSMTTPAGTSFPFTGARPSTKRSVCLYIA